ncbi:MAG: pectate lyase, partial [Prolixibacteraceae bacterium]|nr:pectate lyase [Prolixibacteraceae bacterium]
VYVSNLNDDGPGSLRHALDKIEEPRTVLFTVSGTIFLKSQIEIDHGNLTIAGQSAPGDGICVAGAGIDIEADNVIIRYIRFRPGDNAGQETDALTIKRSDRVIVDHCSMSWSTDETCSCYDNTNFTLQWCIISESLNKSVHHKGSHGYGGIWGGKKASFHHNLLAHHKSRNPRLHGSRYHKEPALEKAELVNNVVYNWSSKCIYAGEDGNYHITGNYFKPGPATSEKKRTQILEPYEPYSNFYFQGNTIEGERAASANNFLTVYSDDSIDHYFSNEPVFAPGLLAEDPALAYEKVLESAGASLYRDPVDQRIVKEVRERSFTFGNKGIIDTQEQTMGWPELKQGTVPPDADADGMPDQWEVMKQLNPNNPADGNHFQPDQQLTHLEIYLNSLCEKSK